ncbi:cobalt/nickel transport system ATP-binding protein [Thermanaeromonas toyohensis ToBE]|uniref:ABC transporter ATP-binding protein n=1 Tax=Thermanaeromonas toyohensis ToBE TaxID=698762 RepID=A0A1W1VY31_9FIRM|nr:ATP-binding cassette domain-containing protein [Thermanaeromonas toyohensis]SMB98265.1 cobalt/nickel transport system ATP-binding protein [Thermanaeromonas toyohensis ToBE]
MSYILATESLEYTYPNGTQALRGVSLKIVKGSKTAILGPNGAGKSTLFLHFNGILKPQRGKVIYEGKELRYDRASLLNLRQKVGIVFQDPDTQLFAASVVQEVSFGPFNLGLSSTEVKKRVEKALALTGIEDLADKPTHFLSYGQKKRVCLAAVLAMEPEVLILDEPTAYLDPKLVKQLVDFLEELHRAGQTVILSTHDVDLAYTWADQIFILKAGELAAKGRPEEVFADQELVEGAGLALPWIWEVYQKLKELGWPLEFPPPRSKEELLKRLPCPPETRVPLRVVASSSL